MIVAQRWLWDKGEYIPCILPDECTTIANNLGDKITCAQCKKSITYGDSYCSQVIHTPKYGLGYCVCSECHEKELKEFLKIKPRR